jgi:predicted glycosyltransferase
MVAPSPVPLPNVTFLVKNGIGFGHIRRALVIADAVRRGGAMNPMLVSQAGSLALYETATVPVVNFPLLHRVSSAVVEDCYTEILDKLLGELNPSVIVEDTYPDQRYLKLISIRDRPRLLVLRRLDSLSFDRLRVRGDFSYYDQIFVAQDEEEFAEEGHSPDSHACVRDSGTFTLIGNVFYSPTEAEIAAVSAEYNPRERPLVVVNCGAGGDQAPDGYGDRVLGACRDVAARFLRERHSALFIFITGPYYAGRHIRPAPNVIVRRFEPKLASLLASARVAVIKPGNNVLSEALLGGAHLILIPDVSFQEGLDQHSLRVTNRYGGVVARANVAELYTLIHEGLSRPPRSARTTTNLKGLQTLVTRVAGYGNSYAQSPVQVPARKLLLIVTVRGTEGSGPDQATLGQLVRDMGALLHIAPVSGGNALAAIPPLHTPSTTFEQIVVERDLRPGLAEGLSARGVRVLFALTRAAMTDLNAWLRHRAVPPTFFVVPLETVPGGSHGPLPLLRAIRRLATENPNACVRLDLRACGSIPSLKRYVEAVAKWLETQPIVMITIEDLSRQEARQLMARSPDREANPW